MKKRTVLVLAVVSMCLSGCNRWEAHPSNTHWESGQASSPAGWRARGGRTLQNRITVLGAANTHQPTVDAEYTQTAYNAISHLLATARPPQGNHVESTQGDLYDQEMVAEDAFDSTRPVLYSTTVDLNNYDKTTNFGRLMAEALATALTQHWENKVINVNVRQGSLPIVPRQGEFILSRDTKELALDFNAGAVLLSTYSVALDKVYINVELVNVHHNAIVGAVQFNIPLGPRTEALLRNIEFAEAMDAYMKDTR